MEKMINQETGWQATEDTGGLKKQSYEKKFHGDGEGKAEANEDVSWLREHPAQPKEEGHERVWVSREESV